jgi:Resolvase, N terminal domain
VSESNVAQPALSQGSATVSSMGHLLGYARVSTTDQQPHLQVDALQRAGCYRVFTETASGTRTDRPTLEQLLDQLRPGDTREPAAWWLSGSRSVACASLAAASRSPWACSPWAA